MKTLSPVMKEHRVNLRLVLAEARFDVRDIEQQIARLKYRRKVLNLKIVELESRVSLLNPENQNDD